MSKFLVSQYQTKIEKLIQHGGSKHEASIRRAFENLLDEYCKTKNYELIAELEYPTKSGKIVKPDGTVKDAIRMAIGYWESKDQYDNLNEEIEKKFAKGYPNDNIIFEDSQTAVLYQNGEEVLRVSMQDADALDRLLIQFIHYDRPEVRDFRAAIAQFKEDVPDILEALRSTIQAQEESNEPFKQKRDQFWGICQASINPEISAFDIQEMLIQHILTEDIFLNIFGESQFHQENNIASELQAVVKTFFKGNIKRDTRDRTKHFYAVIERTAASIANHHEKQKFLKVIYENFYKAYNPKAADRLGIVYTPNEIVRFMIESADYLTHKHFGKLLADPGVEILDPATGTGTFITELIEYLPANKLEYKYKHEIHCNEVAILPYYVANLNIELTYKQKMGKYEEFQNICFVDTLDHTSFEGKQGDLFAMSVENTERIKRQNDKKISVIIGNPPYNANQHNENDNNKNREYAAIDDRIKKTYIKQSKAQKTKLYDMYSRFFRWATDRLGKQGIIAFITNSSFIDTRNFDGFRKVASEEFDEIYVIDLGGNVRRNPKLSGTTHNVFGIQAGVAITLLVRKEVENRQSPCKIFYARQPEFDRSVEKLRFLAENSFSQISFEHISPDKNHNWLDITDNDFEDFLCLSSKETRDAKKQEEENSIFKLFSLGVSTNRDEWIVNHSCDDLCKRMTFFVKSYDKPQDRQETAEAEIKWSRNLKRAYQTGQTEVFDKNKIISYLYRPYSNFYVYNSDIFVDEHGLTKKFFGKNHQNLVICFTHPGSEKPFMSLVTNKTSDLHLVGAGAGTQCLPLYRYDKNGDRIDNITDWALTEFHKRYLPSPSLPPSPAGEGGVREEVEDELVHLAGARRQISEELLQRARELRKQQTSAEKVLWECLRASRLCGAKFRRQHNIGQYIADFYCSAARLVIELDGNIHASQQDRDSDRDIWMQSNGLTVLRFNNEAVTQNIEQTLQTIASYLPSPAGEGLGVRADASAEETWTITKLDIFHYVYAVLHHPAYRTKYELNLKREFPRIPFYDNFQQWADWGKQLMDLHINFETAEPYDLERIGEGLLDETHTTIQASLLGDDSSTQAATPKQATPKCKLKADKVAGVIELDTVTSLSGIPAIAWDYKLGNRSALEWILDQYKEKKPKDPTIAKLFNTYRFADYKEHVIELLQKVCTVSVETMKIIQQMPDTVG